MILTEGDALCREHVEAFDYWQTKPTSAKATEECRAICRACPLLAACEQWIATEEHGAHRTARLEMVVAAMTPAERHARDDDTPPAGRGGRPRKEHGTGPAYKRHLAAGTRPCHACAEANRAEKARYREAKRAQAKSEAARAVVTGGLKGRRVS